MSLDGDLQQAQQSKKLDLTERGEFQPVKTDLLLQLTHSSLYANHQRVVDISPELRNQIESYAASSTTSTNATTHPSQHHSTSVQPQFNQQQPPPPPPPQQQQQLQPLQSNLIQPPIHQITDMYYVFPREKKEEHAYQLKQFEHLSKNPEFLLSIIPHMHEFTNSKWRNVLQERLQLHAHLRDFDLTEAYIDTNPKYVFVAQLSMRWNGQIYVGIGFSKGKKKEAMHFASFSLLLTVTVEFLFEICKKYDINPQRLAQPPVLMKQQLDDQQHLNHQLQQQHFNGNNNNKNFPSSPTNSTKRDPFIKTEYDPNSPPGPGRGRAHSSSTCSQTSSNHKYQLTQPHDSHHTQIFTKPLVDPVCPNLLERSLLAYVLFGPLFLPQQRQLALYQFLAELQYRLIATQTIQSSAAALMLSLCNQGDYILAQYPLAPHMNDIIHRLQLKVIFIPFTPPTFYDQIKINQIRHNPSLVHEAPIAFTPNPIDPTILQPSPFHSLKTSQYPDYCLYTSTTSLSSQSKILLSQNDNERKRAIIPSFDNIHYAPTLQLDYLETLLHLFHPKCIVLNSTFLNTLTQEQLIKQVVSFNLHQQQQQQNYQQQNEESLSPTTHIDDSYMSPTSNPQSPKMSSLRSSKRSQRVFLVVDTTFHSVFSQYDYHLPHSSTFAEHPLVTYLRVMQNYYPNHYQVRLPQSTPNVDESQQQQQQQQHQQQGIKTEIEHVPATIIKVEDPSNTPHSPTHTATATTINFNQDEHIYQPDTAPELCIACYGNTSFALGNNDLAYIYTDSSLYADIMKHQSTPSSQPSPFSSHLLIHLMDFLRTPPAEPIIPLHQNDDRTDTLSTQFSGGMSDTMSQHSLQPRQQFQSTSAGNLRPNLKDILAHVATVGDCLIQSTISNNNNNNINSDTTTLLELRQLLYSYTYNQHREAQEQKRFSRADSILAQSYNQDPNDDNHHNNNNNNDDHDKNNSNQTQQQFIFPQSDWRLPLYFKYISTTTPQLSELYPITEPYLPNTDPTLPQQNHNWFSTRHFFDLWVMPQHHNHNLFLIENHTNLLQQRCTEFIRTKEHNDRLMQLPVGATTFNNGNHSPTMTATTRPYPQKSSNKISHGDENGLSDNSSSDRTNSAKSDRFSTNLHNLINKWLFENILSSNQSVASFTPPPLVLSASHTHSNSLDQTIRSNSYIAQLLYPKLCDSFQLDIFQVNPDDHFFHFISNSQLGEIYSQIEKRFPALFQFKPIKCQDQNNHMKNNDTNDHTNHCCALCLPIRIHLLALHPNQKKRVAQLFESSQNALIGYELAFKQQQLQDQFPSSQPFLYQQQHQQLITSSSIMPLYTEVKELWFQPRRTPASAGPNAIIKGTTNSQLVPTMISSNNNNNIDSNQADAVKQFREQFGPNQSTRSSNHNRTPTHNQNQFFSTPHHQRTTSMTGQPLTTHRANQVSYTKPIDMTTGMQHKQQPPQPPQQQQSPLLHQQLQQPQSPLLHHHQQSPPPPPPQPHLQQPLQQQQQHLFPYQQQQISQQPQQLQHNRPPAPPTDLQNNQRLRAASTSAHLPHSSMQQSQPSTMLHQQPIQQQQQQPQMTIPHMMTTTTTTSQHQPFQHPPPQSTYQSQPSQQPQQTYQHPFASHQQPPQQQQQPPPPQQQQTNSFSLHNTMSLTPSMHHQQQQQQPTQQQPQLQQYSSIPPSNQDLFSFDIYATPSTATTQTMPSTHSSSASHATFPSQSNGSAYTQPQSAYSAQTSGSAYQLPPHGYTTQYYQQSTAQSQNQIGFPHHQQPTTNSLPHSQASQQHQITFPSHQQQQLYPPTNQGPYPY